ncbi:MAG: hypothetical protein KBS63_00425 [Clostridiales bacterium]|nr:hypothetical protein [Candidatus Crickella caballi]
MLTMDLKSVLISILLIALIVLVIYLIVLINKLTHTIKNVNSVMDGGEKAAANVKEKVDNKVAVVKEKTAIVEKYAGKGLGLVSGVVAKFIK